ncbi:GNAT family N-acetyltransferase [Streptomyces sp. NPDC086783]|uniref:GNAT family N-acetyltransferase n=1 Tax=Streptomyces sp. NPDC086783 TaxID=3365758 RepID=UPI003830C1E0
MTAETYTIRHMIPDDLAGATSALTECFIEDPFFAWLCPDEQLRPYVVRSWMGLSTSRSLERGHSYVALAEEGIVGASLFSPPGVDIASPLELRGQSLAASAIVGMDMKRYATLQPVSAMQPKSPHFYLRDIGVIVAARGNGIGKKLVEATHAICDRENWTAYLETTRADSKRFFETLGYHTVKKVTVSNTLVFTAMLRHPGPPGPDRRK